MTESEDLIEAMIRLKVPKGVVAKTLGKDVSVGSKLLAKKRRLQVDEIGRIRELVAQYERDAGEHGVIVQAERLEDRIASGLVGDYVPVDVLPTYAGMGGGGTGDDDEARALLPRALVQDELRASPADLLVINVRGNSMVPMFQHGDQLVIDKRDTNPTQPGAFALWYDDGYVVKNVERIRATGRLRIFSSNPEYSPDEADPEEVRIMGRPVWFARRL